MTVSYLPGTIATLTAEWRSYLGGPLVTVTGVTITIVPAAGGPAVLATTAVGVTYPVVGVNAYAWTVPPGAADGDYIVTWSGTDAALDTVTATELVTVAAGPGFIVSLADVKAHGNITGVASDTELLGFVAAAQEMIESEVGAVMVRVVTGELHQRASGSEVWLHVTPVISVESLTDNGSVVDPTGYTLDPSVGRILRTVVSSGYQYGYSVALTTVSYTAGRLVVPPAIMWATKELAIHLWRSTQAQRGGRSRGDSDVVPAGYGVPNRVRDALIPHMRLPAVG